MKRSDTSNYIFPMCYILCLCAVVCKKNCKTIDRGECTSCDHPYSAPPHCCDCLPPYIKVNGVCRCPDGHVDIDGTCKRKTNFL